METQGGIALDCPASRAYALAVQVTSWTRGFDMALTIAKPVESKIKAFGMEFKNAGKSAFSAPFNWAG
jgi:hypothetical protein